MKMEKISFNKLQELYLAQLKYENSKIKEFDVKIGDRKMKIRLDKVFEEKKLQLIKEEVKEWFSVLVKSTLSSTRDYAQGFEILKDIPYIMAVKYFTNFKGIEDVGTFSPVENVKYYIHMLRTISSEEYMDRYTGISLFTLIVTKFDKNEFSKLVDAIEEVFEQEDIEVTEQLDLLEELEKSKNII